MSVSITLDPASQAHLNRQLDLLRLQGPRTVYSSMIKVARKIASEANSRLRGRGHVVTSRLRNSIFVKTKNAPTKTYQSNAVTLANGTSVPAKTWVAELAGVGVGNMEVAIGTNVDYAQKIENMDSFLGWAINNVDIEKSIKEDLQDLRAGGGRFAI